MVDERAAAMITGCERWWGRVAAEKTFSKSPIRKRTTGIVRMTGKVSRAGPNRTSACSHRWYISASFSWGLPVDLVSVARKARPATARAAAEI